eukprot:746730-Hanusia_phi.AAC.1
MLSRKHQNVRARAGGRGELEPGTGQRRAEQSREGEEEKRRGTFDQMLGKIKEDKIPVREEEEEEEKAMELSH